MIVSTNLSLTRERKKSLREDRKGSAEMREKFKFGWGFVTCHLLRKEKTGHDKGRGTAGEFKTLRTHKGGGGIPLLKESHEEYQGVRATL